MKRLVDYMDLTYMQDVLFESHLIFSVAFLMTSKPLLLTFLFLFSFIK